uniref:Uncharacterized protein n=1 Tax=Fibrocapsa japonica TaxID=94617 RepID=A0A6U1QKS6_9STRA
METSSWRVVKVYGEGPSPRASCTMCPGVHDGTFIVYGGQTESDVRDAYEFNVHDRRWRKLHLENAPPHLGSIYGHTTCLHKESLIFFGGTSGNSFWNDICSLNLFTMKYEAISTTGDAPSPRYKHQSQIVGNMMYVIGGGTFTTCSKEIDVFCLDLSTYTWMKISALGDLPPSRVAHSTAYDEHSRSIFLWGGNDGSKNRFQDFYTFNIDTCTWKEISQDSAHLPPPRAFHTSCFYEGSFYIFGGSNNNAFLSDAWYFPTRVTPPRLTTILANMIVDQASKDQNYLIHNF